MFLVYLLAFVGFLTLVFFAMIGILAAIRHGRPEVEAEYEEAVAALGNIQAAAWDAMRELQKVVTDAAK